MHLKERQEKFLLMSRHLNNTFLVLNNCLSVIIGKGTLIDVMRIDTGALFNTSDKMMNKLTMEEAFGDYTPGRFAWLLENAIAFKTPMGV